MRSGIDVDANTTNGRDGCCMAETSSQTSNLPIAGIASVALAAIALLIVRDAPFVATRPPDPAHSVYTIHAIQRVETRLWQDPFSAVEDFEHAETVRLKFDTEAGSYAGGSGKPSASPSVSVVATVSTEEGFSASRFGVPLADFKAYVGQLGVTQQGKKKLGVLAVMMSGSHFVGAEEARRRTRYAVLSALGELEYAPVDNEHIGYVVTQLQKNEPVRVPFELYSEADTTVPTDPAFPQKVLVLWIDDAALSGGRRDVDWTRNMQRLFDVLGVCDRSSQDCFTRIIGPYSSDEYTVLLRDSSGVLGVGNLPPIVSPSVTSDFQQTKEVPGVLRMISKDDQVLGAIIGELVDNRDVSICAPRGSPAKTILLFGEWDTEYGRRADQALQGSLKNAKSTHCSADSVSPRVSFYTFVTGLDGVTISNGAGRSLEGSGPGATASGSATQQIEWPESADQRDYIRRLGQRLQLRSEKEEPIAVGIIASDTHDKLLLLQALRDRFPRIPFFTTDLDARFVHPMVRKWTRNLIVGSSFGLQLRQEIQVRTPPFRDVYQTATYLGTLVAMQLPADGSGQSKFYELAHNWVQEPLLYEIGRTRPVPLIARFERDSADSAACTPRTLEGCAAVQSPHRGVPLENRITFGCGMLFLAIGAVMLLWARRAPKLQTTTSGAADSTATPPASVPRDVFGLCFSRIFLCGLILSLVLLGYLMFRVLIPAWTILPIEPRFFVEGVSGWPVAICWSVSLALTFMFLVRISRTLEPRFRATESRFICGEVADKSSGSLRDYWGWLSAELLHSAAKPASGDAPVPIEQVWSRYRRNAVGRPRVIRIFVFWLVLFALPFALVHGSELTPVYAVRGGLRIYVQILDWANFVMLTVLMAFVADAVLLCTLFVADLRRQRNAYDQKVLDGTLKSLKLCAGLNNYLAEYIDTELIGLRTSAVASYLYYPFVVLAVLAVSMTSMFDDWAFEWTRVILYSFYGAILALLWLALHQTATRARDLALGEMKIQWLELQATKAIQGCSPSSIRRQFHILVEKVRSSSEGAYGPLLRQPIFRALLWPLSGVSTAQFVSYFLQT